MQFSDLNTGQVDQQEAAIRDALREGNLSMVMSGDDSNGDISVVLLAKPGISVPAVFEFCNILCDTMVRMVREHMEED